MALTDASPLLGRKRCPKGWTIVCRPEMRLGSLDELIARIKADVGIAKAQLDQSEHQPCKAHKIFVR